MLTTHWKAYIIWIIGSQIKDRRLLELKDVFERTEITMKSNLNSKSKTIVTGSSFYFSQKSESLVVGETVRFDQLQYVPTSGVKIGDVHTGLRTGVRRFMVVNFSVPDTCLPKRRFTSSSAHVVEKINQIVLTR